MALAESMQKSRLVHAIARIILKVIGWRTQVIPPGSSRYVLIGAPHTSNWDFVMVLLLMVTENIHVRWMGKDTLFTGPLGVLMRSLGVIPVNRSVKTNLVDQIVRSPCGAGEHPRMMLCDERRAHRVLLEAGLGQEVASSFLVLASAGPGAGAAVPDSQTLA